jgi:hypothetical protein
MRTGTRTRGKRILAIAGLTTAGITATATNAFAAPGVTDSAKGGVSPVSCLSSYVVLEGQSSGHRYNCTGNHSVNDYIWYVSSGSWSGYIYTSAGTIRFCNNTNTSLGAWTWTTSVYLSPTRLC